MKTTEQCRPRSLVWNLGPGSLLIWAWGVFASKELGVEVLWVLGLSPKKYQDALQASIKGFLHSLGTVRSGSAFADSGEARDGMLAAVVVVGDLKKVGRQLFDDVRPGSVELRNRDIVRVDGQLAAALVLQGLPGGDVVSESNDGIFHDVPPVCPEPAGVPKRQCSFKKELRNNECLIRVVLEFGDASLQFGFVHGSELPVLLLGLPDDERCWLEMHIIFFEFIW